MSLVPTTVELSPVAERPPRTGTRAAWLIAGCYLLGALAVTRLRLAPDASVLVVPGQLAHSEVMHWQADTGEPSSMVGGYFLGPGPNGQATFGMGGPQQYAATYLNQLWSGRTGQTPPALVRSAMAYWHPVAVIAVTRAGSVLGHFLIRLLGRPTFAVGKLLVWRR